MNYSFGIPKFSWRGLAQINRKRKLPQLISNVMVHDIRAVDKIPTPAAVLCNGWHIFHVIEPVSDNK